MKKNTKVDSQEVKNNKMLVFDEKSCPVTATMQVLGGKWKAILINAIYHTSV